MLPLSASSLLPTTWRSPNPISFLSAAFPRKSSGESSARSYRSLGAGPPAWSRSSPSSSFPVSSASRAASRSFDTAPVSVSFLGFSKSSKRRYRIQVLAMMNSHSCSYRDFFHKPDPLLDFRSVFTRNSLAVWWKSCIRESEIYTNRPQRFRILVLRCSLSRSKSSKQEESS